MKKMMTILCVFVMCVFGFTSVFGADLNNTVKGKMEIQYNSRTQTEDSGNPNPGVKDFYKIELDVTDTIRIQGGIEHLPTILSSTLGMEKQAGNLMYNLNMMLRNPSDPKQVKMVGKLTGGVPIDKKGVYKYNDGTLRMAIDATGKAAGFQSAFRGFADGKPPKGTSVIASIKKRAITITKQVQGKTVKIVATDYDKMAYNGLVLAAGPTKTYPETIVNGEMLYDYERSAWYFNGVTMSYTDANGKSYSDKLTGNIKWIENPQRATNGEGEYQFDVRFNEPAQAADESAAFQAADDEAAFFATDTKMPSLTGAAKYKDQMRGETVASSAVVIDLVGNNLTKQQIVNATKLIWLVNVVPMNAE
ncbi:MAG: hypothetical protein WC438_02855 [Candidatus Pacearchaeota archaeon]